MSMQFQVFIGYDPRQPLAFNVANHSLMSRLSRPAPVTRLQLDQLPIKRRGLTEFTYSRYIVPFLSGFDGYSLFLDSDTLVLGDVWRIFDNLDPSASISIVNHEGQLAFERASVVLFNNKRCATLTPEFIEDTNNKMFDLVWASRIGTLLPEWNHLVGYNKPNPEAKIVHFTKGIPCWPETKGTEFVTEWSEEMFRMSHTCSFEELMGGSVHVGPRAVQPAELPSQPMEEPVLIFDTTQRRAVKKKPARRVKARVARR
jgi:hypothetical protein